MKLVLVLVLLSLTLVATGEVLECVMFVNPYETWCDYK
jgi:hypothetical protein